MAKQKEPQAPRQPTRRQLSHWQKQALRQRIIGIVGIVTILAVILLVVGGWFFNQYLPVDRHMHDTVVEVNGQKYDMAYFIDAVKYYDMVYFSGDPQYIPYILDAAEQNIEQFALMKEAAKELGISVSEADIDKQIKDNSLPTNQAVRDIVHGGLLRDKLMSDYFEPEVPASGDTRDVIAMFLESQSKLEEIKAKINAGADFGELAASDSLDSTTQGASGVLGAHAKGVFDYKLGTEGFDDIIFAQNVGSWGAFEDAEKSKQVGYWLVKITGREADNSKVHVSGILLGSEEEALKVKAELEAGGDFATLAEKYSQKWSDTAGDDLGWLESSATDVFKDFVFDPANAVGAVSGPIKDASQSTDGGVWLFKVLSSETKDTSADDKTDLTSKAFNDWLTALQEDAADTIVNSLDDAKKAFATAQASR